MAVQIVLFLLVVVLIVNLTMLLLSSKRDALIHLKLDWILSQANFDYSSIHIPDKIHATIMWYLDKEPDGSISNQKSTSNQKSVENALSCLTEELKVPRTIAEKILEEKYQTAIN